MNSWARLQPQPEVILFGDDVGTAEIARELGFRHQPEIECNEYGTPLVSSMFKIASEIAANDVVAYVNADIILTSDFPKAVRSVSQLRDRFLMIGRRWGLNVETPWAFESPEWEAKLWEEVTNDGRPPPWSALEYFVFPRGLYSDMPPFAIGRTVWDNWIVYRARSLGVPVVDATESVLAVHQDHDYSHHPEGTEGVWRGPEARHNLALAGGDGHRFSIADSTHKLIDGQLRRALDLPYLWRRLYTLPEFFPVLRPLRWVADILLGSSRSARKKMGWVFSGYPDRSGPRFFR